MSLTMAPPVIRVAVGSPPSIFVLSNVLVGLSGDPVPWDRWLEVLSSSNEGIYSEEDFEWTVAGLLPCPRSMFALQYNNRGVLHVIFTPRPNCIANYRAYESSLARLRSMGAPDVVQPPTPGACGLCYSPLTFPIRECKYRRGLHHMDLYDSELPWEPMW